MSLEVDGDLTLINTAYTGPGTLKVAGVRYRKARLWILEDRTVVAIVPGEGGVGIERLALGEAEKVTFTSRRNLTVELRERDASVLFQEADCACGMGEVGSSSPVVHGPWRIVRVRRPDWITET